MRPVSRPATAASDARHDGRPSVVRSSSRLPNDRASDERGASVADGRTIVFFPEGAYGPTNNCVGIGDVLRRRGHRVVFIVEESFAGTLEAKGFEERLMRLGPPPAEPEVPGPVLDRLHPGHRAGLPQVDARADRRVHRADLAGAHRRREVRQPAARADHRRARARRDRRGQRRLVPGRHGERAAVGPDRVVQPGRAQGPDRGPVLVGLRGRRPEPVGDLPGRVQPGPRRLVEGASTRSAATTARAASATRRSAPSSCTNPRS